jgi:hypothetical protein
MAKKFNFLTVTFAFLFAVSLAFDFALKTPFTKSVAITLGTFTYHFVMRLLVGHLINKIFQSNVNYNRKWFKTTKIENKIYKFLRVKQFKKHVPTYQPQAFSLENGIQSVIKATCQAEIVHEIIVVLSFLPTIMCIWFGEFLVFFITSVLAALVDVLFIVLQRYNRPRLLKLIKVKE